MTRPLHVDGITGVVEPVLDFSGAIRGGHSDLGVPVRHLRRADNVRGDPYRALGVRRGYRDLVASVLADPGHSLMRYYSPNGNKTFVAAGAKIYQIVEGGGYLEQPIPGSWSSRRWSSTNLNGTLIATQEGGTNAPLAYNGLSWLSTVLPAPPAGAITTLVAGGSADLGLHNFRLRHRFRNGSSQPSPVFTATPTSGSQIVRISNIPLSPRSDFVGWTLEFTKVGFPDLWYLATDGPSASATTYDFALSDAAFGTLIGAGVGVHGDAPHLEGVIAFKNLLLGWEGTNLWVSQDVEDSVEGAGVFNFHPEHFFPFAADDGDAIQQCVPQGDRLVVLKAESLHGLQGFDFLSFQAQTIPSSVGAASTRGATVIGSTVFFYGGLGRIFRLDGDKLSRTGLLEVGHYLDEMDVSRDADVVMFNDGDYVGMAYTAPPDQYNRHVVVHRLAFNQWWHDTEMRISDVLVPKRAAEFSRARLLFADPKRLPSVGSQSFTQNPSFVTWQDGRGTYQQVYVQKLDSVGTPLWTTNGVLVSQANNSSNMRPVVLDDGASGCFVVWQDNRSGSRNDVYAQRYNTNGIAQWTAGGVVVCALGGDDVQTALAMCSDGAGGFICVWADNRGTPKQHFAQRLDASGAVQWAVNGVAISNFAGTTLIGKIMTVPDGQGGAFVALGNYTAGPGSRLAVQRIDAFGTVLWGASGTQVANNSAAYVHSMRLCRDGQGGVFVVWNDTTHRAQRLNGGGAIQLAALGVDLAPLGVSSGSVFQSGLCSDGSTGLFVFSDEYNGGVYRLRGQKINAAGALLLGNGNVIYSSPNAGSVASIDCVQDGAGGAIVGWHTEPGYVGSEARVQRVDPNGLALWSSQGIVLSPIGAGNVVLVSDGGGGCIASWQDGRGSTYDVYSQRVSAAGVIMWTPLGVPTCVAAGSQANQSMAFTGAAPTESPVVLTDGFHVWSGYDGFSDERPVGGSTGTPIHWKFVTPDWDGGMPDVLKAFMRLVLFVKLGRGSLVANLSIDAGASQSAVALNANFGITRWGSVAALPGPSTLIWNQGKWAKNKAGEIVAPLPAGTTGKKASLSLSADLTDDLVLAGYTYDLERLPDRTM